ncbi:MAG TPA: spore cortex biosynthesis protein YabQ [Firmicutes bacterium]|nr:spore cortex biosynthesis protein YabQ [Bacillota bacterium]
METMISQVVAFGATMLIGGVLGLVFDFYRVLRGIGSPTPIVTTIGDILFWIIATAVSFYILLKVTWADVRFYVFIGFLVGFNLYRAFLSRPVIHILLSSYSAGKAASYWIDQVGYRLSDVVRSHVREPIGMFVSRITQHKGRKGRP